ncbi:SAM-dependent methyltransferase [Actinoplanes sp. NPDC051411]|uniref:class I SAM-dependent methyltransferase n=1 Tax=Actinoplanes sp. NPDC051411 TaxID=3155522 RepID=UPI00343EFF91
MATRRVRNTAFGAATFKAFEQYTPAGQRLFDDPVGPRLLSGFPAAMVRHRLLRTASAALMNRIAPGLIGAMACRTRAIDDAVTDALAAGNRQMVILGAGLDTRAHRLPVLRQVPVWELDLDQLQRSKVAALSTATDAAVPAVTYVPIDFAHTPIAGALAAAGFGAAVPTVVIWEGVSQYLSRSEADATIRFVAGLASGSRLVFTYVPQTVIDDPRHARTVSRLQWHTGYDQAALGTVLSNLGLNLVEDLGADDYRARYLEPLGREIAVSDLERMAVADVR